MHEASHLLGLDNAGGAWYLFWSGFFGDITIFAGMGVFYWKHTCISRGCWRVGKRTVTNTSHVVCHKHHPEKQPTAQKILKDYRENI